MSELASKKSAEEVAAQREVKKSEDSIRKLESKLNKLAEGSAERATAQADVDALKARISELCAQFGIETKADKKAQGKAQATSNKKEAEGSTSVPLNNSTSAVANAAATNAAPALAISTIATTAPGARVDPARLREELESCKAKLSVATDPKQMDELKVRLATLLDACISMASEQATLATARASPAVLPQSMTPFQGAMLSPPVSGGGVPTMDLPSSAAVTKDATADTTDATSATSRAANKKGAAASAGLTSPTAAGGPSNGTSALASATKDVYGGASSASDDVSDVIHPRFVDLAIRTRMLQVVGGNARTLAFIDAILAFVRTTKTLSEDIKELGPREKNEFTKHLLANVELLNKARPLCQGMKHVMTTLSTRIKFGEFVEQSNVFVRDQVARAVAEVGDGLLDTINKVAQRTQEVADNDTILVYGRSSSIEALLLNVVKERKREANSSAANNAGAAAPSPSAAAAAVGSSNSGGSSSIAVSSAAGRLKVIVLDSAPLFEGRGLAKRLQTAGVAVRYALASAACQLMPLCTKVFLGSSAVMQSGDVVSRCGTAMVAACAKACQRPVFVFAEDHKLTREVWIGSLTRNESVTNAFPEIAGNTIHQQRVFGPDSPPPTGHLYDVTPNGLIDVIVTRLGRIHPSAVCSLIASEGDDDQRRGLVDGNATTEEESEGSSSTSI